MRLEAALPALDEFHEELGSAIEEENTLFYIDTSVLFWLIRVAAPARREFINWCSARPVGSVRVPVWVANELANLLVEEKVSREVKETIKDAMKRIDRVRILASERADDQLCRSRGYVGRHHYVGQVEQSAQRLVDLAKVAADVTRIADAEDEVISFVNAYVLDSKLQPIFERVSAIGALRVEQGHPPGYRDAGKDFNRFGDLIIWEELVADVAAALAADSGYPRSVIVVTREQKTDWLRGVRRLRTAGRPPVKIDRNVGRDVISVHPLLLHELRCRSGCNQLYIMAPHLLATLVHRKALLTRGVSSVAQWLASSFRADLVARQAALEGLSASSPKPATSQRDSESDLALLKAELDKIGLLTVANIAGSREAWTRVEAAKVDVENTLEALTTDVALGRISSLLFGLLLGKLSVEQPSLVISELLTIVERVRDEVTLLELNKLVLGILTVVYFDKHGVLLRKPRCELGMMILELEGEPELLPAFERIGSFLRDAGAELAFVPGTGRKAVEFEIEAKPIGKGERRLQDLRLGGESILLEEVSENNPRLLTRILEKDERRCRGVELRSVLAREFLVPVNLLRSDHDDRSFVWSSRLGLAEMDTGASGGVSAFTEENWDE